MKPTPKPRAPVGEKPPPLPPKTYTNEMLHQEPGSHESPDGIVKILPKAPIETFNFSAPGREPGRGKARAPGQGKRSTPCGALATGFVGALGRGTAPDLGLKIAPTRGPKPIIPERWLVVVFAAGLGHAGRDHRGFEIWPTDHR